MFIEDYISRTENKFIKKSDIKNLFNDPVIKRKYSLHKHLYKQFIQELENNLEPFKRQYCIDGVRFSDILLNYELIEN